MAGYKIVPSSKFRKDIKKYLKKKKERGAIYEVVDLLADGGNSSIPIRMKPHKLSGNYVGYWECHALPDLLIIWGQTENPEKEVYLARVGTHSDLF